ncbi:replication-relaxation family protein [Streptomyces agglomeratus]|uniref:replication-relaxation family protein n=1 Tax=Streptomyces agglomeratus TaxID=285458 RepID=UPI000A9E8488
MLVGGTKARPYGSTTKRPRPARQIRQLTCPGTADAQTVRNAAKDLGVEGLVVSLGSATRINDKGNRVSEKLWNLTPAGLQAPSVVLDREVKEMGGTAKASVPSGAPHARKVTDTITAFLQPVPEPTRPVVRKNQPPPTPTVRQTTAGRPGPRGRHAGLVGDEVVLPVAGTFTTPVKGSPRADAVLTAPGAGLPVLFVEVDNGTETGRSWPRFFKYRRFFRRTVKDTGAREISMWQTLYGDHGRQGHRLWRSCSQAGGARGDDEPYDGHPRPLHGVLEGPLAGRHPLRVRCEGRLPPLRRHRPRHHPPPAYRSTDPTGPSGGATGIPRGRPSKRLWTTRTTTGRSTSAMRNAASSGAPRRSASSASGRRPSGGRRPPLGRVRPAAVTSTERRLAVRTGGQRLHCVRLRQGAGAPGGRGTGG